MSFMDSYSLLQLLASPVTAITARDGDRTGGMIANSSGRASLVPDCPRVSFYCFRQHHTHGLIESSGWFGFHLVGREQFRLVYDLGFRSGREEDKLTDHPTRLSPTHELPLLTEPPAAMECEVVNAMNAGPSTYFLGEVRRVHGPGNPLEREDLMTSEHWRKNMPEEWREEYEENKRAIQTWAEDRLDVDRSYRWRPEESGQSSSS